VTELRQLTRPVVRRGTGLHADQAPRQPLEELHHLTAAKLLPDDDLLGRINAVNLEHVLGEIQTDRGNLHVDGSSCDSSQRSPYGNSLPGADAVHHIRSSHSITHHRARADAMHLCRCEAKRALDMGLKK
jgi:hypothetical protein